MTILKNIRVLKGAAVLAERKASSPSLELKRYNLIYGFNGSGKSTLSRIFASLQLGKEHEKLPEKCTFEIELSDGKKLSYPKAHTGFEKHVCVFNGDFISKNLRWEDGVATPVFYISSDQAEAAAQLKRDEAKLPALVAKAEGESKVLGERQKAFSDFKRITAKAISERLRQAARYEAGQLISDVEKLGASQMDALSNADLDAAVATCARSEPPAKVRSVSVPITTIKDMIAAARDLGTKTIGAIVIDGLAEHPKMVPWAKEGHTYHITNGLKSCLYCGEEISDDRKRLLTQAFDDKFSAFVLELNTAEGSASSCVDALAVANAAIPTAAQLSAEFQPPFRSSAEALSKALDNLSPVILAALKVLRDRKGAPTNPVQVSLPAVEDTDLLVAAVESHGDTVNAICQQHSDMVDDFNAHQQAARLLIRKHFVATITAEYSQHESSIAEAAANLENGNNAVGALAASISTLRAQVQQHGPAAEKINGLVKAYLGHGELTIVAVAEGYELHRNASIVKGAPSEGEKTAIALCYFLSTLEADDRKVKDLIVIVDDPVSSLDTKAMNYACAMIRNRLSDAAQVIVLTHNQHCMNEFKKAWKRRVGDDPPTAALKFIDVKIPETTSARTSNIVDLPKHLKDYESEYHYLFEKVLALEAIGEGHFDYAFMMPNVLRRVLEVFLAFKIPSSGDIGGKLKMLCDAHEELDQNKMTALERLSHVESHSDNLDDLITQSSMSVEESRDANAALIHLIKTVDASHLAGLRKYCRP